MKLITLASLMLGLGLSGCQMIAREYHYRIVVVHVGQNGGVTKNRIFDGSREYNYGCGNIGPSGYAANAGPMETPPNDVFTVEWNDEQGKKHEAKFDLRKRVKRSFKGEIVLVYRSDQELTLEICDLPNQYPIPPRQGMSEDISNN